MVKLHGNKFIIWCYDDMEIIVLNYIIEIRIVCT